MHRNSNYTCTKLCKCAASGCIKKASKFDRITIEKIWRKTPLLWKGTNYLPLTRGLYQGYALGVRLILVKVPLGKCPPGRLKRNWRRYNWLIVKTAYDVDKLMEVALKLIHNSATSQLCQCLRQPQMSKYFQCLMGKGSGIPRSIRGQFFLNILLWICQVNASPRNFVHRKYTVNKLCN
jgi:hypothetical protein